MSRKLLTAGLIGSLLLLAAETMAGEFLVGAASADITPSEPVALDGQFELRISQKAATPITANVVALESRQGDRSLDAAVMVSCDFVVISDMLLDKVHQAVQKRLPSLDLKKLFLNATHTHTAPVTRPGVYDIPKTGVMQVEAYCGFAAEPIAEAIEKAWKGRKPGTVSWGLGHAAVAENRRATYADGHAVMYGKTDCPDFRGLEGYEDHDVGTLFFWNDDGKTDRHSGQRVLSVAGTRGPFQHQRRFLASGSPVAAQAVRPGCVRVGMGGRGRRSIAAPDVS